MRLRTFAFLTLVLLLTIKNMPCAAEEEIQMDNLHSMKILENTDLKKHHKLIETDCSKDTDEDRYLSAVHSEYKLGKAVEKKTYYIRNNCFLIPLHKENEVTYITVSAAGDCTLGTDETFGYYGSFVKEADENGYEYFFKNVREIFKNDDLTIVNLETTLTDATKKADKKFCFKGIPEYTSILQEGNIEAVNIANNHIYDYFEKGYKDTINALEKAAIGYFGYENKYFTEIRNIKIGCLGYEGWSSSTSLKQIIKEDIKQLQEAGTMLIIVSFHWGNEREHYPNFTQNELGKHAIDCGADLVLGHHPHVIQGIQTYKGKNIVYSLGNFSFGGNRNPNDKDTFIYQQTFEFQQGRLLNTHNTNIIPCSVSSIKTRNNYQPTPLEGKDAERLLTKIEEYSKDLYKESDS